MSGRPGYAVAAGPQELGGPGPWEGLVPLRPALPEALGASGVGISQGVCPSPAAGPFWAAPRVRGRGGGLATSILRVQLHSAGPGWPQARDLHPVGAAAAQIFPERRRGVHPVGCQLPVCDTHYRNDCVFSLITHYFYAERRLNEGKKQQ